LKSPAAAARKAARVFMGIPGHFQPVTFANEFSGGRWVPPRGY
jgi:hypothetical protein